MSAQSSNILVQETLASEGWGLIFSPLRKNLIKKPGQPGGTGSALAWLQPGFIGGVPMRLALLVLLLPLALAGCLSFSSSNPSPPARDTTVVTPYK
jgi:hypothetical protein